MYPRDWDMFLNMGGGREIAIAQLPGDVVRYLDAWSDKVFLHHDYARKAVVRHGLTVACFPYLFDTIEFGRGLADRPRHVTFFHRTPLGYFQVTVKRAEVSRRLYVSTFYKTNKGEVERKTKKYPVIRQEKWAV